MHTTGTHAALYDFSEPETVAADATWSLDVQVQHDDDGLWHRRAVTQGFTACGKSAIHDRTFSNMRFESYDGMLCRSGCFSAFELEQSRRANKGK